MLKLNLQRRHRGEKDQWNAQQTQAEWEPSRSAVIICDMWDTHTCDSAARRVAEMAPHMNRVVSALRNRGLFIIHAPSDTMRFYADHPARKLALDAPLFEFPKRPDGWCSIPGLSEPPLPVQVTYGGCDCNPHCEIPKDEKWPWTREIEAIEIAPGDAVAEGVEPYNLMKQRGIDRAILMGVHTGMCILNRPFGIKRMTHAGVKMVLVRDLTDAMYNPEAPPYVDHFSGTRLIVEHIEKYWCPTITSNQIIGGKPFRFAADPN